MGRRVLGGEFPAFFHGQTYMGALEAYLDAVPFASLGASVEALRLWPILTSLTHAGLAGLLARRIFGTGWWTVVLALLPAPFLLKWAHDGRLHYDLLLLLTPLLLLLALRALDVGATPAGRTRALLVCALVAGVGWWVNLLTGVVTAAVAFGLLVRRPRLCWAACGLPLAFVLGSAPFWVFSLARGHLAASSVPLTPASALTGNLWLVATTAVPILLGLPRAVAVRIPLAALGTALLVAIAAGSLGGSRVARDGRLLLWALLLVTAGAVVVTQPAGALATDDPRYLLPILAILPVLLGGLPACLAPTAAASAALGLLAVHGAGLWVEYPALFSPDVWRARRLAVSRPLRQAERLADRGVSGVYTHDPDVLTFASGERVVVSHFYQERYPPLAQQVDGMPRPAYLVKDPPRGFDESLTAAGIRFTRERSVLGWLYTDFALGHEAYREIPPDGWIASASDHPERAQHAVDRDAGTHWQSRGPRRTGLWLQVDLGRVHDLGMVAWLPAGFQEVPTGFRLETSLDATSWSLAREVPAYHGPLYWSGGHPMGRVRWGRVEVRFPPRAARHFRVTHLGDDRHFGWTIRELFAYAVVRAAPGAGQDPGAALGALRRAGIRRLYADHGVGARFAALAPGTLAIWPANLQVDAYGTVPPPNGLPTVTPAADAAIVYPVSLPSASSIEAMLRAAGWGFGADEVGGYRILAGFRQAAPPGTALAPRGWRVSGTPPDADAAAVLDGQPHTRWSTRAPQKPGDWLRIDLPAPATLTGVELDLGPFRFDYPRGIAVEVAGTGGAWARVPATPHLVGRIVWTGTHLLRDGVDRVVLRFAPVRTGALRLVQTGSDPVFDWSVTELRLVGP